MVARQKPEKSHDIIQELSVKLLNAVTSSQRENAARLTPAMQYGPESKIVCADFPRSALKWESLDLLQMTDVQFGHRSCKVERVEEYLDWILEAENRFLLLTGDMVDAWAMWSPGTPWEQIADPQRQIYKFVKLFSRVRHRVLGCIGGNHERRAIPGFGDLGLLIATLLRIPYSSGQQIVLINYGKHRPFRVHLWHGSGSARTKGALAQGLHRFMQNNPDSQVVLCGHAHQSIVLPDARQFINIETKRIETRKRYGVIGTSFLEYWGSYAEVAGLPISDVIMGCTRLFPDGKWGVVLR